MGGTQGEAFPFLPPAGSTVARLSRWTGRAQPGRPCKEPRASTTESPKEAAVRLTTVAFSPHCPREAGPGNSDSEGSSQVPPVPACMAGATDPEGISRAGHMHRVLAR